MFLNRLNLIKAFACGLVLLAQPSQTSAASHYEVQTQRPKIKLEKNSHVQKWVEFFISNKQDRYSRPYARGAIYQPLVERVLKSEGLPKDLFFLGLIESGYHTEITSTAAAVGPWQFIRTTGTRYGLKTDYYIDERKDPERATRAAAKYLAELYDEFGSWPLALASYNAGETRVQNAIKRGKTRDFWLLSKKGLLPQETRDYVPKFMAAALIGKNLKKYGIKMKSKVIQLPDKVKVSVPSPIHLKTLSRVAGINYDELRELNPHLHHAVTPPSHLTYEIYVTRTQANLLKRMKTQLESYRLIGLRERPYTSENKVVYYTVREGDTLEGLAKKFRTRAQWIKVLNEIDSDSELAPGQPLRIATQSYWSWK